jgi:hypothetical protein
VEAIGRLLEFDAGPEYARGQSDLQDPMAGILISIPVGQQLAIEASGGGREQVADSVGRWKRALGVASRRESVGMAAEGGGAP